jgi:hypothetical protein
VEQAARVNRAREEAPANSSVLQERNGERGLVAARARVRGARRVPILVSVCRGRKLTRIVTTHPSPAP